MKVIEKKAVIVIMMTALIPILMHSSIRKTMFSEGTGRKSARISIKFALTKLAWRQCVKKVVARKTTHGTKRVSERFTWTIARIFRNTRIYHFTKTPNDRFKVNFITLPKVPVWLIRREMGPSSKMLKPDQRALKTVDKKCARKKT